MPFRIKKVWLITGPSNLATITMESLEPEVAHKKLAFREAFFPEAPTAEHPARHVLILDALSVNDVKSIRNALTAYLLDN